LIKVQVAKHENMLNLINIQIQLRPKKHCENGNVRSHCIGFVIFYFVWADVKGLQNVNNSSEVYMSACLSVSVSQLARL